ncbi:class I SAM-dependent methyltransferase [Saccharomonospora sp. NB11]|uniref:class I SAM-dependent methyltransferase n=1 Tax=Saccharomonospora sp. NB11 TaxID=1642298 RepID=UPI0027DC8EFD|nr:class I SAM-dependent methyltransferase [Saccharomonospora sp. NB11]
MSLSFEPDWLRLRERADATARSTELVASLRHRLTAPVVVADLGCGTGSAARWLAPQLPGPQHWVLYDRDARLLALAEAELPAPHTCRTHVGDLASLRADDLDGVGLVTASALLDLLDRATVDGLVEACVGAGCPALFTLSVTGNVQLWPAHPLDAAVRAAFNDHQRREGALGPDASATTAAAFRRRGAAVTVRSSPWRLGADDRALVEQWLRGWVEAAFEQRPDPAFTDYLARRLDECAAGALRVEVGHEDLLAVPADA